MESEIRDARVTAAGAVAEGPPGVVVAPGAVAAAPAGVAAVRAPER
jgi:hypothetical protein